MTRPWEADSVIVLDASLQRALVAYGAGAILAGAVTHAMSLGDAWSLLGSGGGSFIVAGRFGSRGGPSR